MNYWKIATSSFIVFTTLFLSVFMYGTLIPFLISQPDDLAVVIGIFSVFIWGAIIGRIIIYVIKRHK